MNSTHASGRCAFTKCATQERYEGILVALPVIIGLGFPPRGAKNRSGQVINREVLLSNSRRHKCGDYPHSGTVPARLQQQNQALESEIVEAMEFNDERDETEEMHPRDRH